MAVSCSERCGAPLVPPSLPALLYAHTDVRLGNWFLSAIAVVHCFCHVIGWDHNYWAAASVSSTLRYSATLFFDINSKLGKTLGQVNLLCYTVYWLYVWEKRSSTETLLWPVPLQFKALLHRIWKQFTLRKVQGEKTLQSLLFFKYC